MMKALKNKFTGLILLFICFAIGLSGCQKERKTRTFHAMGGIPVNIIAVGLNDSTLDRITDMARNSIEEWESELSMFRPESVVNQLAKASDEPVYFSEYGWEALQLAMKAEAITNHSFDVTVGPVIRLWRDADRNNMLPEYEAINKALSYTSFDLLELNESSRSARLKQVKSDVSSDTASKFVLDFGGIAKGLFAEWLNKDLYENLSTKEKSGLEKLIVDIGGDMFVKSMSDKNPCQIGIRNPFEQTLLWGIIELAHGAAVTSGTYERFFEIDGIRYCHIVDPETGWPIETDLVSVTITDPSGAIADALATAVFVMGEEYAVKLINTRPETELVLIRNDGSHYVSEGLKKHLRIL